MEPSKTSTNQEEDDYIDMEVSSSSNIYCPSKSSPPQSREFEFQMSSVSQERETTTPSPADELFYKGNLLPLHLPPRLQLVQKLLLQNSKPSNDTSQEASDEEQQCGNTPFITTTSFTAPPTNSNTPLDQSCNISPSESCRVSCELNPDEYFFQWSTAMTAFSFIGGANHPKKSWSKKFRLVKQSSLTQKLKASGTYLKSFFTKSAACPDESSAKTAGINHAEAAGNVSKAKEYLNKHIKVGKKNPFGHFDKQLADEDILTCATTHRRSFSGAIKRHCATKCLSSTSSSNSSSSSSSFSLKSNNGFYELNFLKRSSSANSEIENAIEGAIAHCKKSQQQHDSVKTETEVGSYLLSASRVRPCGGNDMKELCRI
ncbi:hypothetical protein Ancab_031936 [Ancistrocladus abbreviatus]